MIERLLSELRHRWRALWHRDQLEHELDDELRFHLEREAAKLEAKGVPPAEAVRMARVALGGVERIKEDARQVRGTVLLEQLWGDLRHAIRTLRARPVFTIGVAGTLALGIGANAAMFGIVDRLMFRDPTGLREPARVHRVHLQWMQDGERRSDRNMQFPRFRDFVRDARSLDAVGAFQVRPVALGRGDDTREGLVAIVSASFLDFFDAPPALGRWFTAAEDEPPAGAPVVVLSHAFWQTRYGGRADVLGQSLQVDRLDATIIGVAPPGFAGIADDGAPTVFVPLSAFAHAFRGSRYVASYNWGWIELLVRRRPEMSVQAAESDLTQAFISSWRREDAARGAGSTIEGANPSVSLGPVHLGRGPDASLDARVTLWLTGVALLVLLIACANITNLFLSRAVSRQREVALRLALGVGRWRLARQILLESLVLGVLGGLAGMFLARFGGGTLGALLLPDGSDLPIFSDARTIGYAFALAIAAALVTSIVPAMMATRMDVSHALKAGGRSASPRRSRLQRSLVVVQSALSVLLLVGAALFVRSLQRAESHRLGFDVAPLLYAEVNMRGTKVDSTAALALVARLETAAREIPGVTHVSTTTSVPFWTNEGRKLLVSGIDSVRRLGQFTLQTGSGDYFAATGTRILAGRPLGEGDRAGAMPVAVVSEGMAKALWPGRNALGACFRIDDASSPCRVVVGIAEESAMNSLTPTREFTYYLPVAQFPEAVSPQFYIRVADGGNAPLTALRSRLQRELPGAAFVNVVPMSELLAPQYRGWRLGATMFAAFGGLALLVAALGLHSLVSYETAQREKELGVRLALGASRGRLLQLIVGQGTRLAAIGVVVGVGLALVVSRPLSGLMFEQSTRDPVVFGAIAMGLLAVAVLASFIPGWRATRLDPATTLRGD